MLVLTRHASIWMRQGSRAHDSRLLWIAGTQVGLHEHTTLVDTGNARSCR
jgi:hypothetical protein